MSCCSFLDLMWSLNPIELQGIVFRPSLPQSPPTHPPPSGVFVLLAPHPNPPRLSSSTVPIQNFFKCLIFPPLASFCRRPLTCLSIDFSSLCSLLPTHLPLFLLALSQHFVCIFPVSHWSVLLLMQTDLSLLIYLKLVGLVIWGR